MPVAARGCFAKDSAELDTTEVTACTHANILTHRPILYNRDYVCVCVCVHAHSVVSDSLDPMDCSLPGSLVRGIFQARILDWSGLPFPSPGDLPHPGIELHLLHWQMDSTTSPPGKPTTKNYLAEDVSSAEVEKPWFNSTAASQSQLETDVLGSPLPLQPFTLLLGKISLLTWPQRSRGGSHPLFTQSWIQPHQPLGLSKHSST